tara:strand:+ start:93 stop:200 length:108 start_codon:yes stop_codon:yes gene_type:complete
MAIGSKIEDIYNTLKRDWLRSPNGKILIALKNKMH